ncbi:ATP/GTP-binding protein [Streptomyces sp. NPDC002004]
MLRKAAAAAALLVGGLVPVAYGADGPSAGVCRGATLFVKVCAQDGGSSPATGRLRRAGASGRGKSSGPSCTYTKLVPQPPPENMYWHGHQSEKGAVYGVSCPGTDTARTVFIPAGTKAPTGPQIDPQVLARRAADSMKLAGPDIASPRTGGRYVVGMPMWLWVRKSATTYGPNSASATAGGVTVTATAKVSSIAWDMGDGTTVTCTGPGTPYDASQGKNPSPDCGHLYKAASIGQKDEKYAGKATATWTVQWRAAALGDAGEFTETRTTPFSVAVQEVQVVN